MANFTDEDIVQTDSLGSQAADFISGLSQDKDLRAMAAVSCLGTLLGEIIPADEIEGAMIPTMIAVASRALAVASGQVGRHESVGQS